MVINLNQQAKIRVIVHGKTKVLYISLAEITHIVSDESIVHIFTLESDFFSTKQLKDFDDELCQYGFVRINRSTLVNELHIESYSGGSKRILKIIDGTCFPVSRRRAYIFK